MKSFRILLPMLFLALPAAPAPPENTELEWHTSLQEVHELSQKTHKPVFAFFTGSDWCGWCHKLQNDVFSKKEFIDWAKKNVVLLELDFPRRKQLPQELMQQNYGMQQALHVSGYPTVWLLYTARDSTGNFSLSPLGSLGYPHDTEPGREQVKFLDEANRLLSAAPKN
jgi:thioredoxin-related protein